MTQAIVLKFCMWTLLSGGHFCRNFGSNQSFTVTGIGQLLVEGMQLFIPLYKVHSNQDPIWYNSEIRHCINRLRTLRRRYKCHPTNHISSIIDSIENTLQDKIKVAKQDVE